MAVRKVVVGLVTNPLCRAGDVAVLPPSRALTRAIERGWVEVTHTVEDGVVVDEAPVQPRYVPEEEMPPVVENGPPVGTVDEVNRWIGSDRDRALTVLDSGESRKGVLSHVEALLEDGDESPGELPWEEVPLFE